MMPELATPHRNSLGYAVNNDARRYEPGAKIVWGQSADGSFVSISNAASGIQPDLRCDCGSPLVAKKGDLLAHHFAHAAGAVASCQKAKVGALARFARHVLQSPALLFLPRRSAAQSSISVAIEDVMLLDGPVLLICRKASRKLRLYITTSASQKALVESMPHDSGPSAVLIDITKLHSRDDPTLRDAILQLAPRSWLHDARDAESPKVAASPIDHEPTAKADRRPNPHHRQGGSQYGPLPTPRPKLTGEDFAKHLNKLYPVGDEIARLRIKRDARARRDR